MSTWLAVILIAYFILSISNLIDKIFLSQIVPESIVYTVWVSLLSVTAVALFVMHWFLDHDAYTTLRTLGDLNFMTPWFMILSVLVGFIFTFAIYFLYTSLQRGEASRVLPLIGGTMPILIFVMTFSYAQLNQKEIIAFFFLVAGTILISMTPQSPEHTNGPTGMALGLAASFSFALYFVLTQYIFNNQGFINGIVWPRLGSAASLVIFFLNPHVRRMMAESLRPLSLRMKAIWVGSQGLGALGFLGQQYVISIPGVSVALVSALQSVQYAFILLIATGFSIWKPSLLKEFVSTPIIIQKAFALICIGVGLYFISI